MTHVPTGTAKGKPICVFNALRVDCPKVVFRSQDVKLKPSRCCQSIARLT